MKRQLLPILVIAIAMVAIAAFRWGDPYHAFCGPCWADLVDKIHTEKGDNVNCVPIADGTQALCKRTVIRP